MLKLAKDSAVKARARAVHRLRALLINAEPGPRERLASLAPARPLGACAALEHADHDGVTAVVVHALASLARRTRQLDDEIRGRHRRIAAARRGG